MPTRDRRAGPNGSRRPQRAAEKRGRELILHAMFHRAAWGRVSQGERPTFSAPTERDAEHPEAESARQFATALGLLPPDSDEQF